MLNALWRSMFPVIMIPQSALAGSIHLTQTGGQRSEVRNELLDDDPNVQFVSEDTSIDDDFDKELEEPSIKSLAEALHVTDQLRHFAQFNGYQDLALAVGKASDVISSLQLLAPKKRQTALTYY